MYGNEQTGKISIARLAEVSLGCLVPRIDAAGERKWNRGSVCRSFVSSSWTFLWGEKCRKKSPTHLGFIRIHSNSLRVTRMRRTHGLAPYVRKWKGSAPNSPPSWPSAAVIWSAASTRSSNCCGSVQRPPMQVILKSRFRREPQTLHPSILAGRIGFLFRPHLPKMQCPGISCSKARF